MTEGITWTPGTILHVALLFLAAGMAEIGGGWMVWKAMRENKPWWWALLGSLVLVGYGFIPTLQPLDDFGRLYAVYGGIFIGLSFIWGALFDDMKIDNGDIIGSLISFVGVAFILYWPRDDSASGAPNRQLLGQGVATDDGAAYHTLS